MGQLDCNLLFRRLVGLNVEYGQPIRNSAVFSENRERLLKYGKAVQSYSCHPNSAGCPGNFRVVEKVVYTPRVWKAKQRILCGFCQGHGRKATPV
jgi:hypothetical protein